jgi:AcrR family transcriptional regulator
MAEKAPTSAKTRGRPRNYDPDQALWLALEKFWEGGFAATSLDALASSTGMNRPSLYAAFGDKKALYLKTLDRFAAEMRTAVLQGLFENKQIADALMQFYQGAIEVYLGGAGCPRGCYILSTAPAEAITDEDVRGMLNQILLELDAGIEARLKQAQADGQLAPGANTATLAMLAGATLHSIAIRARAGEPRKALESLASQAVSLIAPRLD